MLYTPLAAPACPRISLLRPSFWPVQMLGGSRVRIYPLTEGTQLSRRPYIHF